VQQEWLLRLHAPLKLLAGRNVPLGLDGTHNSLRSHTDGHAGSSPDMYGAAHAQGMAELLDGAMGRREAADAGAGAGAAQALAVASVVPSGPLRSVAAHDGGCFALAFDRCACDRCLQAERLLTKLWLSRACDTY